MKPSTISRENRWQKITACHLPVLLFLISSCGAPFAGSSKATSPTDPEYEDANASSVSSSGLEEDELDRHAGYSSINQEKPPFVIRFKQGITTEEQKNILDSAGLRLLQDLNRDGLVQVTPNAENQLLDQKALERLEPHIDYLEEDVIVTGYEYAPTDPAFLNTSTSYGLHLIDALRAWDITLGDRNIVIAVLDSGLSLEHEEFAGRIVPGLNTFDAAALPEDDHGHGTHVAGIVAAEINNAAGSAGVCPQCSIMPVKVLNQDNLGTFGNVAAGIYFAVDQGAQVINLSLGAQVSSRTIEDAVRYAVDHNVLLVSAIGNNGTNAIVYPAGLDGVVGVSAVAEDDAFFSISNYGSHVDFSAPGRKIYSSYRNNSFASMSGTSMAAPFVAGLAGLLLSVKSELTLPEIFALLRFGANDQLGLPGKDDQFGYGRVNAYRSLVALTGDLKMNEREEAISARVMAYFSQSRGLPQERFQLMDFLPMQWPNPGIGCPQKDTIFASVITPGYKWYLKVDDQTYIVHSDSLINGEITSCP